MKFGALTGGLPWRWIGLALALAGIVFGLLRWGDGREEAGYKAGTEHMRLQWVQDALNRANAAREVEIAYRQEEQRRAAAHQEAIDEARKVAERARSDAVVAAAATGRLQQRVSDLLAAARDRAAARDPAASTGSQAADDAAGVLADVLGRCVERVRLLATVADERGAAGAACERAYDALIVPAGSP